VLQQPDRGDKSAQLTSGMCLFLCLHRKVHGIIVPAFWFKGFAIAPELCLLKNDDNEMQRVASSLAATKLEDLLTEFIECNLVLIVSNIALFVVAWVDC
jgi:hypothetical protein